MKKHMCIFIFLLISLNIFANTKYNENIYFFTTDRLKLRKNSDLQSDVITVLDKGTCLLFLEMGESAKIDGKEDNWIKVRIIPKKNGKIHSIEEGWVYGGYVDAPEKIIPEFSDEKVKCILISKNYIEPEKGISGESEHQYFFIENNTFLIESITYKTEFLGPNYELYCYSYERIENSKKIVYLAYTNENDGSGGVNIYSIDITDYENAINTYGYKPKENDKRVKNYISYYLDDFNHANNLKVPSDKEYKAYKNPDKTSEVAGTFGVKDLFVLDVRANNKLKFEENKSGFWVKAATAYDGIPFERKEFYWIWIE